MVRMGMIITTQIRKKPKIILFLYIAGFFEKDSKDKKLLKIND
jgi:hypothetical protein